MKFKLFALCYFFLTTTNITASNLQTSTIIPNEEVSENSLSGDLMQNKIIMNEGLIS